MVELNKVNIVEALNKIVSYLEEAEREHYEESSLQSQEVHIYKSVVIAKKWLKSFDEEALKGVALLLKDRFKCVQLCNKYHYTFLDELGEESFFLKLESLDQEELWNYLQVSEEDIKEAMEQKNKTENLYSPEELNQFIEDETEEYKAVIKRMIENSEVKI